LPAVKHFEARLLKVTKVHGKFRADVEVVINEMAMVFHDRPMALSREATTWHPIGGYGCK